MQQISKVSLVSLTDHFLEDIGDNHHSLIKNVKNDLEKFIKYLTESEYLKDLKEITQMIEEVKMIKKIYSGNLTTKDIDNSIILIMNGLDKHATFQLIHNENEIYHHYFFNSGLGISLQKDPKDPNSELYHEFKPSSIGSVNPLLYKKSIKQEKINDQPYESNVSAYYDVYLSEYTSDQKIKIFVDQQFVGNCATRAVIYPMYLILFIFYKKEDNYINNFILIVKLFFIHNNFEKNEQIINEQRIYNDDLLHLKFIKDLIIRLTESSYSSNKSGNIYSTIINNLKKGILENIDNLLITSLNSDYSVMKPGIALELKPIPQTSIESKLPIIKKNDLYDQIKKYDNLEEKFDGGIHTFHVKFPYNLEKLVRRIAGLNKNRLDDNYPVTASDIIDRLILICNHFISLNNGFNITNIPLTYFDVEPIKTNEGTTIFTPIPPFIRFNESIKSENISSIIGESPLLSKIYEDINSKLIDNYTIRHYIPDDKAIKKGKCTVSLYVPKEFVYKDYVKDIIDFYRDIYKYMEKLHNTKLNKAFLAKKRIFFEDSLDYDAIMNAKITKSEFQVKDFYLNNSLDTFIKAIQNYIIKPTTDRCNLVTIAPRKVSILHDELFNNDVSINNRIIMRNIELMYKATSDDKSWNEISKDILKKKLGLMHKATSDDKSWDKISVDILNIGKKNGMYFRESMGLTDEYVDIFCRDNELRSHCSSIKNILNGINTNGLNYFTRKIKDNIRLDSIYHAINLICTKIKQNSDIIEKEFTDGGGLSAMGYFMDNIKLDAFFYIKDYIKYIIDSCNPNISNHKNIIIKIFDIENLCLKLLEDMRNSDNNYIGQQNIAILQESEIKIWDTYTSLISQLIDNSALRLSVMVTYNAFLITFVNYINELISRDMKNIYIPEMITKTDMIYKIKDMFSEIESKQIYLNIPVKSVSNKTEFVFNKSDEYKIYD